MSVLKQILDIMPVPVQEIYLKYKYNRQLSEWEKKGKPLPPPHIIKQNVIKSYQKKHSSKQVHS